MESPRLRMISARRSSVTMLGSGSKSNAGNRSTPSNMRSLSAHASLRRSVSTLSMQRTNTGNATFKTTAVVSNIAGNGSSIKKSISSILAACEQQSSSQASSPKAPEEECFKLAQWATDTYLKVLITSNAGIHALVHAMDTFPDSAGVQECCCLAIDKLCSGSESNKYAASAAGAVKAIVRTMKLYPNSIAVQGAACGALRNLPLVAEPEISQELLSVFEHAKSMCLLPRHRRSAEHLLAITQEQLKDPRW